VYSRGGDWGNGLMMRFNDLKQARKEYLSFVGSDIHRFRVLESVNEYHLVVDLSIVWSEMYVEYNGLHTLWVKLTKHIAVGETFEGSFSRVINYDKPFPLLNVVFRYPLQ